MVDEGSELFAQITDYCKQQHINVLRNRTGARFAERSIRTIKKGVDDRVRSHGGRWSDYIDDVVKQYSETEHSTTKFAPDELADKE